MATPIRNRYTNVRSESIGFHVNGKAFIPSKLPAVVFMMASLGLAIAFGTVAATGNLLAIAAAAGVLIGSFLLGHRNYAVWLIIVGALLVNGVVGLALPGLTKLAWLISMLGFFLLAGSLFSLLTTSNPKLNVPTFIWILICQMILAIGTSFVSDSALLEIIAGSKRTYQLIGLMLAIAIMPTNRESARQIGVWLKFILAVALLQLPAAVFERVVLVPARVGMTGGVVPIDIVSGTFEASIEGGGSSSIMVIFLIAVLSYILASWRDKAISFKLTATLVALLGAPLFLGETKIALILLPLMLAMVFATEIRKRPVMAVISLGVAALLTTLLAWVYLAVLSSSSISTEQQIQKTIDYNFGSVGYYDRYSLNRTTATTFWISEHGLQNPVETVFGHGIGSSYSGAGSLAPGHLNSKYPFMAINLTALSTLLWDTGLLGTALFLSAFFLAWRASAQLLARASPGGARAVIIAMRVSLACNAFTLIYSNSMFASLSHQTILAVTFGYIAWALRLKDTSNKVGVATA